MQPGGHIVYTLVDYAHCLGSLSTVGICEEDYTQETVHCCLVQIAHCLQFEHCGDFTKFQQCVAVHRVPKCTGIHIHGSV